MALHATPVWDDDEEDFSASSHEREQRAKKEREHKIKCDHLRERLWDAVERGDDDAVFLVIRHVERDENIDSMTDIIDPMTPDGVSTVYKACKHGNAECARQLLVAGASAGRATKQGKLTPLFAAAMGGHPQCIELLLKQRDIRVEHRTKDGRTALYAAAEGGNPVCVQMLIDAKAKIDTRRQDNSTPLIVASYFGHQDVVEVLLKAGAKLKLRDEDGTALANAQRQRKDACVALLEEALKERGAFEEAEPEEEEQDIY